MSLHPLKSISIFLLGSLVSIGYAAEALVKTEESHENTLKSITDCYNSDLEPLYIEIYRNINKLNDKFSSILRNLEDDINYLKQDKFQTNEYVQGLLKAANFKKLTEDYLAQSKLFITHFEHLRKMQMNI